MGAILLKIGGVQFEKEASQTRDFARGSPRSFASQTTLAQDEKQIAPLPKNRVSQFSSSREDMRRVGITDAGKVARADRSLLRIC
jgi:hypothetical protein